MVALKQRGVFNASVNRSSWQASHSRSELTVGRRDTKEPIGQTERIEQASAFVVLENSLPVKLQARQVRSVDELPWFTTISPGTQVLRTMQLGRLLVLVKPSVQLAHTRTEVAVAT